MKKTLPTAAAMVAVFVTIASHSVLTRAQSAPAGQGSQAGSAPASTMSFFITSANPGKGADLGGIAGADKYCQSLAQAVGAGGKTWHAYLSASPANGQPAVNAKDRIGAGPWVNAKGVQVASSVADLHTESNKLGKDNSLTEKGEKVNGRGDQPNKHDILTGSQLDGTAFTSGDNLTCQNWTAGGDGSAQVGHHDRQGGGANPNSWNSAHASKGCGLEALRGTGGDGLFYCFAVKVK